MDISYDDNEEGFVPVPTELTKPDSWQPELCNLVETGRISYRLAVTITASKVALDIAAAEYDALLQKLPEPERSAMIGGPTVMAEFLADINGVFSFEAEKIADEVIRESLEQVYRPEATIIDLLEGLVPGQGVSLYAIVLTAVTEGMKAPKS